MIGAIRIASHSVDADGEEAGVLEPGEALVLGLYTIRALLAAAAVMI